MPSTDSLPDTTRASTVTVSPTDTSESVVISTVKLVGSSGEKSWSRTHADSVAVNATEISDKVLRE